MRHGAATFRAALDAAKPGVVLEAEGMPPIEQLHDHHLSWAQWFADSDAPGVLQHKWLERRHMQHQTRRWDRDHSAELHSAWMNGSGVMVWGNRIWIMERLERARSFGSAHNVAGPASLQQIVFAWTLDAAGGNPSCRRVRVVVGR